VRTATRANVATIPISGSTSPLEIPITDEARCAVEAPFG
jgi:hypothetical protein